MLVRAEAYFVHDGKAVRPGDQVETDEANAKDLIAMGFASTAKANTTEVKRHYQRRDMTAEK